MSLTIRPYKPGDQRAIEELEARVGMYADADQALVEDMHARAARARAASAGWIPHKPEPDDIKDIPRWYAAFWVAELDGVVIGMVGVRREFIPGSAPPRDNWHARDDVAELRRLRVAGEHRRLGIGRALTQAVIDWARADGCSELCLHTSTAQAPAMALYQRMGFRETSRVFVGEYEYVWYAMEL